MAGRKDKNTVDYFPHYCISGKTMFILENQFGHLGYYVWYKTLELLGSSANHYIDLRNDTDLLFLISKMKITEQQLNDIYSLLSKLDAIDLELWNERIIFSKNFIKNIEDVYKRRSKDVYTKEYLCEHILNICIQKSNKSKHKTTKESKVNKSKVNKSTFYDEFSFYKKDFEQIWINEFLPLKRKKRASLTDRALKQGLNKIKELSNDSYRKALQILEKSVNSGWTDFYPLDKSNTKPKSKINKSFDEKANYMGDNREL